MNVRAYLIDAPWWVLSLIQGVWFGVAMGVVNYADGSDGWASAVVTGVTSGVLFGAFMGPITARQQRRQRAAAGDLPTQDLVVAYRAAWRGPVPRDPRIRSAALRTAARLLKIARRQRAPRTIMFAALAAVSVALASDSWWWLLCALVFVALLGQQWYQPYRFRRRIDLLSSDGDHEPARS